MYLSRLILNPRSRHAQREIADRYQLHRTVMSGFPATLPADERVLYRLEDVTPYGLPLLVQSVHAPDWSALLGNSGGSGYLVTGLESNPAVKHFDPMLEAGQVLAFRLLANPTARRRLPDGSKKRVGLIRDEEQREWLARKAQQAGVRVGQVTIREEGLVIGYNGQDGRRQKLSWLAVRYDGLLQVADAEALTSALREGIGSAKSFGFGLLSLARREG